MKRGHFILLSGLGITAIAIPTWYFTSQKDTLLTEPELLSHIWDNKTIGDIGEKYRVKFPNENNEDILEKLLSVHSSNSSTKTIERLRKQISDDYTEGNTFMIDGWILSRTELRQCALFSITHNI